MRKKILTLALFVGAMLLLTATGVLAASPTATNLHPLLYEPTTDSTITPTGTITNPVATMIAAFFNLDVAQVQTWHDDDRMGYGEIAIALFLAQSGDTSVEEIIALYHEGLGWGEIAKELGLAPGSKGRNLGAIVSGRGVVTTTYPGPAKAIAQRFGVPITDVLALHEEGISWGAIRKAFALSQESGGAETPQDILSMHQDEGMSWGQIKKALGLIENPGVQNRNTQKERIQIREKNQPQHRERENHPGRGRGR